ncbi:MAG: peptidoglycan-binding domain-containing protein [Parcubacteria group bacterium]|jgi:peptidoglycan hydrolase-like protein with peptidoglycan-binding domain
MSITPATGLESYNLNMSAKKGSGPVLRQGVQGSPVKALQTYLNRLGSKLAVDGIFGDATEIAVINLQKRSQLTTDGVVGPLTWNAIAQSLGESFSVTGSINAFTGEHVPAEGASSGVMSTGAWALVALAVIGGIYLWSEQ